MRPRTPGRHPKPGTPAAPAKREYHHASKEGECNHTGVGRKGLQPCRQDNKLRPRTPERHPKPGIWFQAVGIIQETLGSQLAPSRQAGPCEATSIVPGSQAYHCQVSFRASRLARRADSQLGVPSHATHFAHQHGRAKGPSAQTAHCRPRKHSETYEMQHRNATLLWENLGHGNSLGISAGW